MNLWLWKMAAMICPAAKSLRAARILIHQRGMMRCHGNEPRQAFLLRCPCKAFDVTCMCCERQLAPVVLLVDYFPGPSHLFIRLTIR